HVLEGAADGRRRAQPGALPAAVAPMDGQRPAQSADPADRFAGGCFVKIDPLLPMIATGVAPRISIPAQRQRGDRARSCAGRRSSPISGYFTSAYTAACATSTPPLLTDRVAW